MCGPIALPRTGSRTGGPGLPSGLTSVVHKLVQPCSERFQSRVAPPSGRGAATMSRAFVHRPHWAGTTARAKSTSVQSRRAGAWLASQQETSHRASSRNSRVCAAG